MTIYEVYNQHQGYWYKADNKQSYRVFKSLGYRCRRKRVKPTSSPAHPLSAEVKRLVESPS